MLYTILNIQNNVFLANYPQLQNVVSGLVHNDSEQIVRVWIFQNIVSGDYALHSIYIYFYIII